MAMYKRVKQSIGKQSFADKQSRKDIASGVKFNRKINKASPGTTKKRGKNSGTLRWG